MFLPTSMATERSTSKSGVSYAIIMLISREKPMAPKGELEAEPPSIRAIAGMGSK